MSRRGERGRTHRWPGSSPRRRPGRPRPAGIFSVIRVPITFPPEELHGVQLSGMGADLRGTARALYHGKPGQRLCGRRASLRPEECHDHRSRADGSTKPVRSRRMPLEMRVHPLCVQRQDHGAPRQWQSPYAHPGHLLSVDIAGVSVRPKIEGPRDRHSSDTAGVGYVTHPYRSAPAGRAHFLSPRAPRSQAPGLFATLGQYEDTWALNEGISRTRISCNSVRDDGEPGASWILWTRANKVNICVFDGLDRVQHTFGRHG
jgi:hypothetical protein